ncbi:MAG TPA: site-2 protease family protein [Candidatus Cloacimonadota bacterium]|nr:site-2 protease family protein [Candidatus Cloacimonadota bacterium]HPS37931.1 site-2 protease family protein [Candidatus Cloacimonadota bacterium]
MIERIVLNGTIVLLVFYSIIIHEVSHAWAANWLGDDTAQRQRRLSLNPLRHVDIFGTVILPLLLYFSAGFVFGYAKPVPINPYNFRDFKRDSGITAIAGPLSNILIAVVFALIYHLTQTNLYMAAVCTYVIFLNLLLALFNLIPIPPLDGSKVLGMFLSDTAYYRWTLQERKGMFILIAVLIGSNLVGLNPVGHLLMPIVRFCMNLLGVGL